MKNAYNLIQYMINKIITRGLFTLALASCLLCTLKDYDCVDGG